MLKIMREKTFKEALHNAEYNAEYKGYYNALTLIEKILRNEEGKIYLEPVTIASGQSIKDSLFIGCKPCALLLDPKLSREVSEKHK